MVKENNFIRKGMSYRRKASMGTEKEYTVLSAFYAWKDRF